MANRNTAPALERSEREREAYDVRDVGATNGSWHDFFRHVFECPNTLRHLARFDQLLSSYAKGKRVLEIGCASGDLSQRLLNADPFFIYGIDVSVAQIEEARKKEVEGRLEFSLADASGAIAGQYDLIFGRSILHHLDYRPLLERLYRVNLSVGGTMIFLEPLGSNPLIKLYHLMSRAGHTPDERPLLRDDLAWLRTHFRESEIMPANLLSFIVGVPSSFISSRTDNVALRLSDSTDTWLATHVPFLAPYFRAAIIIIRKTCG